MKTLVTDCACPDDLIMEKMVDRLVPVEDGKDSWTRANPRRYEPKPHVHHSFWVGDQRYGTFHRLDLDS